MKMGNVTAVTTIQTQVYRILRDEIYAGVYTPGQRLQETELAAKLNVSRSPVREAFRQLIADGLLEGVPNKGVYVREFTIKDVNEIFELRVLMESYAIERMEPGLSQEQEDSFTRILEDMDVACTNRDTETYMRLDTAFHHLLIRSCGNSLLESTYNKTIALVKQFIRLALCTRSDLWDSKGEHDEIVAYLRKKQIREASLANRRHLETTRAALVAYMFPES